MGADSRTPWELKRSLVQVSPQHSAICHTVASMSEADFVTGSISIFKAKVIYVYLSFPRGYYNPPPTTVDLRFLFIKSSGGYVTPYFRSLFKEHYIVLECIK